jgi:hypothetical protein
VQSRGTQDHILLSQFLRLPQSGGPGTHIYIISPQEKGGPDIPPRHWVPFPSPLTTGRATVEVFYPACTQENNMPSQSHIMTDGRARSGTCDQRFFLKVAVLSLRGALSDERSGLSFVTVSL